MMLSNVQYQNTKSCTTLVIIHGLFGEGNNWRGIAQKLSSGNPPQSVLTVDLPNHGNSPHDNDAGFQCMVQSLAETLSDSALVSTPVHVLGHSVGGKVALLFALLHPEKVASLLVIDVAPKGYENKHGHILEGLRAVSNARVTSRAQGDEILADYEPDAAVRAFLLKGLIPARNKENGETDSPGYQWKFNREAITQYYDHIRSWPGSMVSNLQYTGPTLFLHSELGGYVVEEDFARIRNYCPSCSIESIPETGHWLHAEKPEEFCERVRSFLAQEIQEEKNEE